VVCFAPRKISDGVALVPSLVAPFRDKIVLAMKFGFNFDANGGQSSMNRKPEQLEKISGR
jgi:hypothetical protein